jgi:hypothetical protein
MENDNAGEWSQGATRIATWRAWFEQQQLQCASLADALGSPTSTHCSTSNFPNSVLKVGLRIRFFLWLPLLRWLSLCAALRLLVLDWPLNAGNSLNCQNGPIRLALCDATLFGSASLAVAGSRMGFFLATPLSSCHTKVSARDWSRRADNNETHNALL